MKRSNFTCITHILYVMCLSVFGFSQAATPVATVDQKAAVRDAQHKLDVIEKQQSQLALQIDKIQKQIDDEGQKLLAQQKSAQAVLDKANAAATDGIDAKLWKWDPEALSFSAVPPPAAPANASTQPAKPATTSPGAAAPPVQQAKK
jgi:hypothetical protein